MRFAYKYRYFRICHTPHHHFFRYLYAKYAVKWGLLPIVSFDEEGADYSSEEQRMLTSRSIVAQGWYARWYDLFLKYKQEIISLFEFDPEVRQSVDAFLAAQPQAEVRLGVHIRRGDYRTWHGGRYYFTDKQYIALVQQFLVLHPGERVNIYICGNDPELDEAVYREALSEASLVFPKGNPGEDLYLLSQCDWLIGAPSTFTLVAAMYRNLPLYWIEDAAQPLTKASFGYFDELFKQIK